MSESGTSGDPSSLRFAAVVEHSKDSSRRESLGETNKKLRK